MSEMFRGCTSFNQPLNKWERKEDKKKNIESSSLGNVTNMNGMFRGCTSFNQPLNDWNISSVTDMNYMFTNCTSFNSDNISSWELSNIQNRDSLFWKEGYSPEYWDENEEWGDGQ
jgi:surface protein